MPSRSYALLEVQVGVKSEVSRGVKPLVISFGEVVRTPSGGEDSYKTIENNGSYINEGTVYIDGEATGVGEYTGSGEWL